MLISNFDNNFPMKMNKDTKNAAPNKMERDSCVGLIKSSKWLNKVKSLIE